MSEDWTDEELEAAVTAYMEMTRLEAEHKPYAKRPIYRDLSKRFGRTEKAFEYRMQNISAVLVELGRPWLRGLKPATNVGKNVRPRLIALLQRLPDEKTPPEHLPTYWDKLPAMREWLIRVASGRHATIGA